MGLPCGRVGWRCLARDGIVLGISAIRSHCKAMEFDHNVVSFFRSIQYSTQVVSQTRFRVNAHLSQLWDCSLRFDRGNVALGLNKVGVDRSVVFVRHTNV